MTAPGTSQLAELARLEEGDDDVERLLRRLVRRAPELVPGCSAAALTLTGPHGRETRSTIERAKGVLMGAHGVSSSEAFALLREEPQRSDRKVSEVAEALLERADPEHGTSDMPWTPVRH